MFVEFRVMGVESRAVVIGVFSVFIIYILQKD
jgi:hypothetical protein